MANTAYSSQLGSFSYEAEDSFADSADNSITATLQLRDDQIDFTGLAQPMIDPSGVYPRMNQRDLYRLGAFGLGTFTTTFDLAGHNATSAGSLSATPIGTLLGHVFGNSVWSQVGGDLTATGDTNTITSTNTTLLEGGLMRVGVSGDTRADGQGTIALDATSSYELGVSLPGTPTESTPDKVFAAGMVYPGSAPGNTDILTSDGSGSNNTLRIQLTTGGGNLSYICRGCAATGVTLLGLNAGEIPQIQIEWSTVAWAPVSAAADAAITVETPVPNSRGSVFINTVTNAGAMTNTRATIQPMEIEITLGHRVEPRFGPGGENNRQSVVGYHRVPAETTVAVTIEAEAETASPAYWLTANPTTAYHLLYTMNTVDQSGVLWYFSRLIQTNNPTMTDWNGLRARRIEFRAATSTIVGGATGFTTTNELTLAPWRLGLC